MKITKLSPLTWDETKQVTEIINETDYLEFENRIKENENTYSVYVKHEHTSDLFHLGKKVIAS